ncbi:MAG: hypothetical protein ABI765_13895 [Gemmatimonadota bacterium]
MRPRNDKQQLLVLGLLILLAAAYAVTRTSEVQTWFEGLGFGMRSLALTGVAMLGAGLIILQRRIRFPGPPRSGLSRAERLVVVVMIVISLASWTSGLAALSIAESVAVVGGTALFLVWAALRSTADRERTAIDWPLDLAALSLSISLAWWGIHPLW